MSSSQMEILNPIDTHSPFPPRSATDNHQSAFYLYEFPSSGYLIYVKSHTVSLTVSDFSHLVFEYSFML